MPVFPPRRLLLWPLKVRAGWKASKHSKRAFFGRGLLFAKREREI